MKRCKVIVLMWLVSAGYMLVSLEEAPALIIYCDLVILIKILVKNFNIYVDHLSCGFFDEFPR